MILRSSTTKLPQNATAFSPTWATLPLLVQEGILTELANNYQGNSADDKRHRVAYATVCLQWQEHFESQTFKTIHLDPSHLGDFRDIIQRRIKKGPDEVGHGGRPSKRRKLAAESAQVSQVDRHMPRIELIRLRVLLEEYDCRTCKQPESGRERVRFVHSWGLWRHGMRLSD